MPDSSSIRFGDPEYTYRKFRDFVLERPQSMFSQDIVLKLVDEVIRLHELLRLEGK